MIHLGVTSMNIDDQILRAYAAITSIRANVPERHEIEAAKDKAQRRQELIELYRKTFANPYVSAGRRLVDDIIEPAETTKYLAQALEALGSKRELRPPKKHGLIPL